MERPFVAPLGGGGEDIEGEIERRIEERVFDKGLQDVGGEAWR